MSREYICYPGKENSKLNLKERPVEKSLVTNKNIQFDWQGVLELDPPREKYPEILCMVQVWDEEKQIYLELLTNNMFWTASTIFNLTKKRWSIERFFKEIKTYLKIKSFLVTSLNAVLIQTWTALITILLLKAFQKPAKHLWHLSNLIAFIRLNLFAKINLHDWLNKPFIELIEALICINCNYSNKLHLKEGGNT